MDTPLYGETTPGQKTLIRACIFLCAALSAGAIIMGAIFGVQDHRAAHFIMAAAVIILLVGGYLMYKWYKEDHIHPKFKVIIILLVFAIVLTNVSLIIYAIAYPIPKPKIITCEGWYSFNLSKCTRLPVDNIKKCGRPGSCLFYTSLSEGCCGNCSEGVDSCKKNATGKSFYINLTDRK